MCNSFKGRIILAALPQEEEYMHFFHRNVNTFGASVGRTIPANRIHEGEYIQLSYMKETTSSIPKGRRIHPALL